MAWQPHPRMELIRASQVGSVEPWSISRKKPVAWAKMVVGADRNPAALPLPKPRREPLFRHSKRPAF